MQPQNISLTQSVPPVPQPLGSYLMEAGLITSAQVAVALNDQKLMNGMRFGEVLVTRGWIQQQTLDFVIKRVIEPERKAAQPVPQTVRTPILKSLAQTPERQPMRAFAEDAGVNWVG
jgi:hypothetical protein